MGTSVDWDRAVFTMDPVFSFNQLFFIVYNIFCLESGSRRDGGIYPNARKGGDLSFNPTCELVLCLAIRDIGH
jgi:hypothetical protein